MEPETAAGYEELLSELHAWPRSEGVKLSDLIHLRDPLRGALQDLIREGSVTVEAFAEKLDLDLDRTNTIVDLLLDHGFLRTVESAEDGTTEYRLWYARAHRREKPLDIWTQVLDHMDGADAPKAAGESDA